MSGDSRLKKALAVTALALITIGFGYYVSRRPMDFRVYYYGALGVFDGSRPVYGPYSGMGWPMHYRYPPLFLLLFAPFTALPLGLAAAVWLTAKAGVLVWLLRRLHRHGLLRAKARGYWLSLLLIAPYVIEDFRYGNAQFFVVALAIAALIVYRDRPAVAGLALGLAISLKVWPAFFVPYLAARRDWKAVAYTAAFVIFLALVPALYFGFSGNLDLLGQWFHQESETQLGASEIWFPNQSLRGVLMRYLTVIDYSQVPDSNYPLVNLAALDPARVRTLWMVMTAAIYGAFLFFVHRRREPDVLLHAALAFCLLALLEPFTQKYALVVLLWPALAAAELAKPRASRLLLYGAIVLILVQPLAPGSGAQRFLQVSGLDFAAAALLALAIAFACRRLPAHSQG